ncbi:MAG: hypothetical protein WAV21_02675 [Minisyncoccia bacterium]
MFQPIVRVLIAALSTIFLWTASAEAVPLGNPFMRGFDNPSQLAEITEQLLRVDPTGQTMLDSSRCKRDGSCARPIDYLEMLQVSDPDAKLASVSQLPGYFRSLVIKAAPPGKYWMACLKPSKKSTSGWRAEDNCIARFFKPGEKAWVNPKTGKVVLAQDCTNPVGKPEKPDGCVYIWLQTRAGDTGFRLKEYGPQELHDDKCNPAILRAGERDYESPWYEECPSVDCNFAQADSILAGMGVRGQRKGSYAPDIGWNILRLPPQVAEKDSPYLFVFCIETPQGDSCGKDIWWNDYRNGIAVVSYTPADHPKGWNGRPRIWHFDHATCMDEKY